MVIFSLVMWWAYPAGEYKALTKVAGGKWTNPLYAYWQAGWYWDFFQDAYRGLLFLGGYVKNREGTRSAHSRSKYNGSNNAGQQFDIDAAFGRCRPEDALPAASAASLRRSVDATRSEKPHMRFSLASSSATLVQQPYRPHSRSPSLRPPPLMIQRSSYGIESETASQYSQQTNIPKRSMRELAQTKGPDSQPARVASRALPELPSRSTTIESHASMQTIKPLAVPPPASISRPDSKKSLARADAHAEVIDPPNRMISTHDPIAAKARASSIIDIPSVTRAWTAAPKVPLPPLPVPPKPEPERAPRSY